MVEIKKSIVNEMKEVLSKRGYDYEEHALTKIVNTSIERKSNLIELLSKHPLWNPEKLMIQFDTDLERNIEINVLKDFIKWLRDNVGGNYSYSKREQAREYHICNFMSYIYGQFFNENMRYYIDEVNKLNENFKIRTNMKASKAIGKICREEGWDKLDGYNVKYAKMCDALNPLKIKRHTVISLNPIDFLLMSNGNSWHSCHDIGTSNDRGCYCSGSISYMLDEHSFLFYTVDASYNGNKIELEKKIQRQVFGYNDEVIAQLRLYPQSNDNGSKNIYDDIRAIVQKVIAECLGKSNMWIKSKSDIEDVIERGYGATCYPDWDYDNPGSQHCSISTLKEREDGKENRHIVFGAEPICIECGWTHEDTESISCCTNYYEDDYEYCHSCGARVYEYEQYWAGDYCYCGDCVTYCEECNEYVPNGEINEIDGLNVCDYCIDNSGYYRPCYNCGSIHYVEDMVCTEEDHWYCEDCESKHTFECHSCGEVHDKYNGNYDEHTESMYCEDCYEKLLEEREELKEVVQHDQIHICLH